MPMESEPETKSKDDEKVLSKETVDTIQKYQNYEKNKEVVTIPFTSVSTRQNAFTMDEGVKVILRYPDMTNELKSKLATPEGKVSALRTLAKGVEVKVTGVSLKGDVPVVYTSCLRVINDRKNVAKEALAEMIKNRDLTPLPASVIRADKGSRTILLDIGGLGIKGICRLSDWTNYVEPSSAEIIMDDIKPGMRVNVKVIGKLPRKLKTDGTVDTIATGAYKCVRKDYTDPYIGLDSTYPKGTVVIGKVVKVLKDKCFVQISGFDKVHLMCFHPWLKDNHHSADSKVNKIMVGHVYSVRVDKCVPEQKIFRGTILKEHEVLTDEKFAGFAEYKERSTNGEVMASAKASDLKEGDK